MKYSWIILGVFALVAISIIFSYSNTPSVNNNQSNLSRNQEGFPNLNYTGSSIVKAKLINVTGGEIVYSTGKYEGNLTLIDSLANNKYKIFVCTKNWSWIKVGSCYSFNYSNIEENVYNHIFDGELSGCYVGELNKSLC